MRIEVPLELEHAGAPAMLVVELPSVMMSAREVAKAFGVPEKTVRADAIAGRLEASISKGSWRISAGSAARIYMTSVMCEAQKAITAKSRRR
jgi:hypothetical protein